MARKQYTFMNGLGDLFMLLITGGLWGIVMIVRVINNK